MATCADNTHTASVVDGGTNIDSGFCAAGTAHDSDVGLTPEDRAEHVFSFMRTSRMVTSLRLTGGDRASSAIDDHRCGRPVQLPDALSH